MTQLKLSLARRRRGKTPKQQDGANGETLPYSAKFEIQIAASRVSPPKRTAGSGISKPTARSFARSCAVKPCPPSERNLTP
jgi:hypothetical protein